MVHEFVVDQLIIAVLGNQKQLYQHHVKCKNTNKCQLTKTLSHDNDHVLQNL